LVTPETFLTFENYWHNLKPDLGRFYDRGVSKWKVLGWYSLFFKGILTLTIDLKKWTLCTGYNYPIKPALEKNILVPPFWKMSNFNSLLTVPSDIDVLFALFSRVFVLSKLTSNQLINTKSLYIYKLQIRPLLEVNKLAKFVRLVFDI
jgi:hypothetical protein